jgi:hypothetical protein
MLFVCPKKFGRLCGPLLFCDRNRNDPLLFFGSDVGNMAATRSKLTLCLAGFLIEYRLRNPVFAASKGLAGLDRNSCVRRLPPRFAARGGQPIDANA